MKRFSILVVILVVGCGPSLPPHAFLVTPEMLAQRQLETRRYDGIKEADLLSASSNVLQDLGYQLENSEPKLGVFTAVKQRSATDTGEIILSIIVTMLSQQPMPWSKDKRRKEMEREVSRQVGGASSSPARSLARSGGSG